MPEAATAPIDARSVGKRIEVLLEASTAAGPVARERSEELVRLVVDLYGAGLERLLTLVDDTVGVRGELLDRLVEDDLVAGLLLVSGLHPYGVEERIGRALDSVRPYLGSHGGDVEFVGISETGVVQLRMLGSCDGCPSSSVTLELAVSEAIEAAAPEVTGIAVKPAGSSTALGGSSTAQGGSPAGAQPTAGFVPVEALRVRTRDQTVASGGNHLTLDEAADPPDGTVRHLFLDGMPVLLCRWRDGRFAYRDLCPQCASDFTAGTGTAALSRELSSGAPLVTCPGCGRHYDVHRAGTGREVDAGHLEPFPLLERDGRLEIVLPAHPPVPA